MSETSIPLVVIGIGGLISWYNPAGLRFIGYTMIPVGIVMLFLKRS